MPVPPRVAGAEVIAWAMLGSALRGLTLFGLIVAVPFAIATLAALAQSPDDLMAVRPAAVLPLIWPVMVGFAGSANWRDARRVDDAGDGAAVIRYAVRSLAIAVTCPLAW